MLVICGSRRACGADSRTMRRFLLVAICFWAGCTGPSSDGGWGLVRGRDRESTSRLAAHTLQADDRSLALAKEAGFAKMHVFSFSVRAGTAAADMQGAVNNRVIKKRSQILRELDIELGLKYRQQFIGETAEILMENDNGQLCGRSERYFMVYLNKTSKKLKKNEMARVKLVENRQNGAIGKIAAKSRDLRKQLVG